jgi:retron-type reverse transcriptase
MANDPIQQLFLNGSIDQSQLFTLLFSADALYATFEQDLAHSPAKGSDRLNGFQFAGRASTECAIAADKCGAGKYRFAPYLENLKIKSRGKPPRLISIPTIRDRIVLSQLNKFLAAIYPERVPKNIAGTYVRDISEKLKNLSPTDTWICCTDIKTFYDSIVQDRLMRQLETRIKCNPANQLIRHALQTPTVPRNTKRTDHSKFRSHLGVPQGLAISNILASIYMQEVDDAMLKLGISYYRYVDDVLMYGSNELINAAQKSLRARLRRRGLSLHSASSGKTKIQPLNSSFGYLGYTFTWPQISVRESTVERFLQSIAAKFSDYTHNKPRRLERFKYLNESRLAEIFLLELNERITGAISQKKRYGWIAYFNQISDLSLLHRLDRAIATMFKRLPDFDRKAPAALRKLSRSYFEMKFDPSGGYVRDYDKIVTRAEKLAFLQERGRVGPEEALTDVQIDDRYDKYLHHVLAAMHADEGDFYG